ncbi:MAG TPA: Ig-like domain-containing protein, partial [Candidatus Thermoplasmatota archaeon]|nr:Ig-like domain-containing protein [Candidatus Thermoplasmatota archaeon]
GGKVPPGHPLTIRFSEAMDKASVMAALQVTPSLAEPLKVEWEGETLKVRGHRALDAGTVYRVLLMATAKDLAGNRLADPHGWSFTTAPGKPTGGGNDCAEDMKKNDREFFRRAGMNMAQYDRVMGEMAEDDANFRKSWCDFNRRNFPGWDYTFLLDPWSSPGFRDPRSLLEPLHDDKDTADEDGSDKKADKPDKGEKKAEKAGKGKKNKKA